MAPFPGFDPYFLLITWASYLWGRLDWFFSMLAEIFLFPKVIELLSPLLRHAQPQLFVLLHLLFTLQWESSFLARLIFFTLPRITSKWIRSSPFLPVLAIIADAHPDLKKLIAWMLFQCSPLRHPCCRLFEARIWLRALAFVHRVLAAQRGPRIPGTPWINEITHHNHDNRAPTPPPAYGVNCSLDCFCKILTTHWRVLSTSLIPSPVNYKHILFNKFIFYYHSQLRSWRLRFCLQVHNLAIKFCFRRLLCSNDSRHKMSLLEPFFLLTPKKVFLKKKCYDLNTQLFKLYYFVLKMSLSSSLTATTSYRTLKIPKEQHGISSWVGAAQRGVLAVFWGEVYFVQTYLI